MTRASIRDRSAAAHASAREATEREPRHRPWLGALLVAGVAAALGAAMAGIPREHAPLPLIARYALEVALPRWKLTEPVNEIVYGTRGFDTFGETFLLLAAVVSVVVITRPREPRRGYFGESAAGAREQQQDDPDVGSDATEEEARSAERREQGEQAPSGGEPVETPDATPLGTPAPETAEAMTVVVRTAIRVVLPILAVAGLYLVTWGYSPGGGFPGGAVILGVLLLVYASYGRRKISKVIRPGLLETIELAGAATDHHDRVPRPGAQRLVQRELAAAGAGADPAVRRHRPAVLRQRADRGRHRPDHRRLRPARHDPRLGAG